MVKTWLGEVEVHPRFTVLQVQPVGRLRPSGTCSENTKHSSVSKPKKKVNSQQAWGKKTTLNSLLTTHNLQCILIFSAPVQYTKGKGSSLFLGPQKQGLVNSVTLVNKQKNTFGVYTKHNLVLCFTPVFLSCPSQALKIEPKGTFVCY